MTTAARAILACAALTAPGCVTGEEAAADIEPLRSAFAAEYAEHGPAPQPLSYQEYLANLPGDDALAAQRDRYAGWAARLAALDEGAFSVCERIDLAKMREASRRASAEAALALDYRARQPDAAGEAGVYAEPLGPRWYDQILDAWLGADVDPDDIHAFGVAETKAARARLDALGPQGEVEAIFDADAVQALFEAAQKTALENLGAEFYDDYGIALANIRASDRGESFPVPGYYSLEEGTFYYNILSNGFDPREAEWLFIHEATPGHHFQFRVMTEQPACDSPLSDIRFAAYLEGWGAYAETLGAALGLYRDTGAEASAVAWDLVRSVRVALDVAINYHGWTDEQALEFWREHVRGREDIAMREITRMRRWPGQVVTYKFGAAKYAEWRGRLAAEHGDDFDIRRYHDAVLRYGDMPLGAFDDIIADAYADNVR